MKRKEKMKRRKENRGGEEKGIFTYHMRG